jgi:hypothetical protein
LLPSSVTATCDIMERYPIPACPEISHRVVPGDYPKTQAMLRNFPDLTRLCRDMIFVHNSVHQATIIREWATSISTWHPSRADQVPGGLVTDEPRSPIAKGSPVNRPPCTVQEANRR